MKRIILLLIPLIVACSNNGGTQAPGTFDLTTYRNGPGPGGPVSLNVLIMNATGTVVDSMQTKAGHGSISLAPGNYHWGVADSTWQLIAESDTVLVQHGDSLQHVVVLKWPLVITPGNVTRDTLVFCPLCV